MKTNDKILTELNEVIQYFIDHKDNEPKTEFCNNVDKLINLQADLANGAEQSDSNCNIPSDVILSLPDEKWIKNKANEQAAFWNGCDGEYTPHYIAETCLNAGMKIIVDKLKGNEA